LGSISSAVTKVFCAFTKNLYSDVDKRGTKSDKYLMDRDFSHVRQKKSVELWCTNSTDLEAKCISLPT